MSTCRLTECGRTTRMSSISLVPWWFTLSDKLPSMEGDGVYEQLPEHATFTERDTYGLLLMLSSFAVSVGDGWPMLAKLLRLERPPTG